MCDYGDDDDNEDDDDDFGGNQHNTLYTEQLVKDARMWSRITNKKLEENAQRERENEQTCTRLQKEYEPNTN